MRAAEPSNTFTSDTPSPADAAAERIAACEERVASAIESSDAMSDWAARNHLRLDRLIDRLYTLIDNLEETDIDTTSLEAVIEALLNGLGELAQDQAALDEHVSALASIDCSSVSLDEWHDWIDVGADLFESIKADVADVRALRSVLRDEARALVAGVLAGTHNPSSDASPNVNPTTQVNPSSSVNPTTLSNPAATSPQVNPSSSTNPASASPHVVPSSTVNPSAVSPQVSPVVV